MPYNKPEQLQMPENLVTEFSAIAAAIRAQRRTSRSDAPASLTERMNDDPPLNFGIEEIFPSTPAVEINPATDVRLGVTRLTVPPHEIAVVEDRYNDEVPILRGRGSSLIKTGRGHIRINMPLRFASDKEVNNELRQLVAQFRTCPFTTVESDFISTAVLLKKADRAAATSYKEALEAKDAAWQQLKNAKATVLGKILKYRGQILAALNTAPDVLLEELQNAPPSKIEEAINGLVAYFTRPSSEGGRWELGQTNAFITEMHEAADGVEHLKKLHGEFVDKSRELAEAQLQAAFAFPAVPVALHQLMASTAPGHPEMIQADLELYYFNTEPFMPVPTFVGPLGNPTGDLANCPTYWDHVNQRLGPESRARMASLSTSPGLGMVRDETRGFLLLEYPTTDLIRIKKDTPKISDQEYTVPAPEGAETSEDTEYRTKVRKLVIGGDSPYIIVDRVAISLENTLAPQPIEGHMYGTLQYMGQMNAKIRITLTVTGEDETHYLYYLQRIHEVKKQSEEVALRFGNKLRRNARILIDHDLVRLFGVQHVLLDRITTRTKAPGVAEVTLDLTEYVSSQEKRERLVLMATQSRASIEKEALNYLVDVASAEIHGVGSKEALDLVAHESDGGVWALGTVYGASGMYGEEEHGAIISRRLLTEALLDDSSIRRKFRDLYLEEIAQSSYVAITQIPQSPDAIPWTLKYKDLPESSAYQQRLQKEAAKTAVAKRVSKLAQECIWRWGRRSLGDYDAWVIDSSGLIEIPAMPTKDHIKRIVNAMHTGSARLEFQKEYWNLQAAVEKGQMIFSGLQNRIAQLRDKTKPSSTYPDLDLPDYAVAYRRLWYAVKAKTSYDLVEADDLNEARLPGRLKQVIRSVVPTYDDLGIRAPYGRKQGDFARKLSDIVDPDYYFFWNKIKTKDLMQRVFETAYEDAGALTGHLQDTRLESLGVVGDGGDKINLRSMARPGALSPTNKYSDSPAPIETNITNIPTLVADQSTGIPTPLPKMLPNSGTGIDFRYKPANKDLQEKLNDINPYDAEHRKRLFQAAIDEVPDRFQRIITAFPTFRLTFAEVDSGELSVWDDFYTYNAIKSMRIRHHKYTPTIAELEIINVTGSLDESKALSSDQAREAWEEADRSGPGKREVFTGELQNLNAFFLNAGTPIAIRLGYSSKEDELEVRFVGQIVSLTPGDVIRVVAQGYESELTVPVNEIIDGRNALSVVTRIMEKSPTSHYGEPALTLDAGSRQGLKNPYSGEIIGDTRKDLEPGAFAGTEGEVNARPRGFYDRFAAAIGGFASQYGESISSIMADRKTNNVFLPLEQNWRGAMSEGTGAKWGIPNVTGLEALHELTRHHPGFVFGTRVYEHRAGAHQVTLFFGRPEQPYVYTALKLDEEREWLEARRQATLEIEDLTAEYMERFLASPFGDSFRSLVYARKGATVGAVVSNVSIGLLRGVGKAVGDQAKLALTPFNRLGLGSDWIEDLPDAGADLLYSGLATQLPLPSRSSELRAIESKLGGEGLHLIAARFFNKHNNDNILAGVLASETIVNGWKVLSRVTAHAMTSGLSELTWEGDRPPAGISLYHYSSWREALTVISEASAGNRDKLNEIMFKAFGEIADEEREIAMSNGEIMRRDYFNSMVRSVIDWMPVWNDFLSLFNSFLQLQITLDGRLAASVHAASTKLDRESLGPRMKRFRYHHFVHSSIDIIKNAITPTHEFMSNRVVVGYPGEESFKKYGEDLVLYQRPSTGDSIDLGYNDDIQPADHRVRVVTEPNAVNRAQAYFCAKSNLAEALRPMYRGQLLLRGHERINPYDVVWVDDRYSGVHGPVEVESVTDHLDQSGYSISIVPQAIVMTESGSEYADTGAAGTWWLGLGLAVSSSAAWLFPTPRHSIAYALTESRLKAKTGKTIEETIKKSLATWVLGTGLYGGKDSGVRVVALTRRGRPWTAGLKGIGSGGWKEHISRKITAIGMGAAKVGGWLIAKWGL